MYVCLYLCVCWSVYLWALLLVLLCPAVRFLYVGRFAATAQRTVLKNDSWVEGGFSILSTFATVYVSVCVCVHKCIWTVFGNTQRIKSIYKQFLHYLANTMQISLRLSLSGATDESFHQISLRITKFSSTNCTHTIKSKTVYCVLCDRSRHKYQNVD